MDIHPHPLQTETVLRTKIALGVFDPFFPVKFRSSDCTILTEVSIEIKLVLYLIKGYVDVITAGY
jgi:hypothetical protein